MESKYKDRTLLQKNSMTINVNKLQKDLPLLIIESTITPSKSNKKIFLFINLFFIVGYDFK